MSVFTEQDLIIIKDNLNLKPRELLPMLSKEYSSRQITACKSYIKNRENELQRMKEYRESNKDKIKQIQKNYREANKDKEKARHKKWREENHEYDLQRRKDYRAGLKEKYNIPDRYGGKAQALVKGILEEYLGQEAIEEKRFKWLKSDKGYVMAVDIYFPKLNLVVEYNGQQHYMPVKFGESQKDSETKFREQQERDKIKYRKLLSRGYNLIVVPYYYKKDWLLEAVEEVLQYGQTEIEGSITRNRLRCRKKSRFIQG